MNANPIRVWVEEINPPATLLFTWTLPEDESLDVDSVDDDVFAAISQAGGVIDAVRQDNGILVEIDPDVTTRYDLATVIRTTINLPDDREEEETTVRTRVWAEDLTATQTRITWFDREAGAPVPEPPERRKVAAWLAVHPGVRSARPDPEGVVVRYDPERLDRGAVGDTVRSAVYTDVPLRERSDQLLKRTPTYGNLARKLATDDRISPLPGAARQAANSRMMGRTGRNTAASTAARFIPGAALISRIHTLLPLLTELSQWSRESDPEIVDEHLSSVGLDRDTLRSDTITAHEIRLFAQESASEKTAELGAKASEGARHAISAGRDFLTTMRNSMQSGAGQEQSADDSGVDRDDEQDEHQH